MRACDLSSSRAPVACSPRETLMLGQYPIRRSFAHKIRAEAPPSTAYVFFNSRFLSAVAEGTIKVQTASAFRAADEITGGRSDPLELIETFRPGAGTRTLRYDEPLMAR